MWPGRRQIGSTADAATDDARGHAPYRKILGQHRVGVSGAAWQSAAPARGRYRGRPVLSPVAQEPGWSEAA